MNKWIASLAAVVLATMLPAAFTPAHGAAPRQINYQGYLTNPAGVPLTGAYPMVFSLCDAATAGTCPWTETQSVAIDKGIFNVALGSVTPLSLTFTAPYFLDIQVNGEQMSVRQPLTSVGYAFMADTAALATNAATATYFTGSISGDVTGTQGATVVNSVGGRTAVQIVSGTDAANSATPTNTVNTMVKRDVSGNFSAGTITANLTGNVSGTAANVTGTVATANGGTGATSPSTALNNLLPTQTGNNGKVLATDGAGTISWITAGGGADTTPPVPGSSGTITATNSGTDIALSWTVATDTTTPQGNLEYTVFYSVANNISTVANAEANGTVVGLPWSSSITARTITGLTVGTTYYFNVAVKDAGLNKVMYTTVSKAPTVPTTNIILYRQGTTPAANYGGRSGANTLCSNSANKPAGYSNFAAFLGVNASDTLAGRQAFSGLSTTTTIRSASGTLIANNWTDLLDGTIASSLVTAGVLPSGSYWNSGSNANGTLGDTCNGWTVGTSGTGVLVDWGNAGATDATWIFNASGKDYCGDTTTHFLCVAW